MAESRAELSSQSWGTDVLVALALRWLVSLLLGSVQSRRDPRRDQAGPVSSCDRKASRDSQS